MRPETIAVHSRSTGPTTSTPRSHVPPIDLSTTYGSARLSEAEESMDQLFAGAPSALSPVYARLHNPTVAEFEAALAGLEGAEGAVAFASGMAAITATVQAAAHAEDGSAPRRHVVAIRPVYGGTDHLLSSGLLGTTTDWVRVGEVAEAVGPDTGLVILETPANPTLVLTDIRAVVQSVRERSRGLGRYVPVAVDSTFATPVLQQPLSLGADLVVHSATKFLGGHGDALGGIVAGSEAWMARLRRIRMVTGAVLHPLAGYLLRRGLQTLHVRLRAQEASARELASRLAVAPQVGRVYYPGLSGDTGERRLLSSQQRGPGSLVSFRLVGGAAAVRRVLESVRLITPAVSLGSVDSLIQAPALLTHRVLSPDARTAAGIPDDLLRMSVGLEAVEDLWEELERVLQTAGRASRAVPAGRVAAAAT